MKNAKKALLLVLCAVLLVAASVAGTLAYLTSNASVSNTFTVGNVSITMVETKVNEYGVALTDENAGTTNEGNTYKLIPGHTYTKDPTITVSENSENCYILVKIENGLGSDATLSMKTGWEKFNESRNTSIWVYGTNSDPVSVSKNDKVTPFTTFKFGDHANPATYKTSSIDVTAYAIQTDTLEDKTAEDLWALLNPQS